ncbi:MAG TPA: hypothetical protein VF008_29430 [Niastella sp.]
MIHLKQVDKLYGRKLILNIKEFNLEKGIYWINGINGSGKTTAKSGIFFPLYVVSRKCPKGLLATVNGTTAPVFTGSFVSGYHTGSWLS